MANGLMFQHTAARRRLEMVGGDWLQYRGFNTQPPEGGWAELDAEFGSIQSFNTQPPEGGWAELDAEFGSIQSFNTQPPEGGWQQPLLKYQESSVSTHSRPKAAAGGYLA